MSDATQRGHIPLVLGGDHSIAMGTLGGMAKAHGPGAALWIDAHGDLNRPSTSPTGNVHGMPLAAALGAAGPRSPATSIPFPRSTRVALVGVRSLDQGERDLIRELDVRVFTMSEIDSLGVERVLREALTYLAGAPFLHVSLDLDAVDPMFAPGVGTPVRGGLSYREAHLALELVAQSGPARLTRRGRGQPDPRSRERDRQARRRARRERTRRPHSLASAPLDGLLGAVAGRLVVDRPLELVRQAVDVEARGFVVRVDVAEAAAERLRACIRR